MNEDFIYWIKNTEVGRRWVRLIAEATEEEEKAHPHVMRARKLRREANEIAFKVDKTKC